MSRTARILVIEDNETNLELMVYLLRAFGYEPVTATDGESGIEVAQRLRPDLLVCDIQLPGVDGYGVVRALKSNPDLARIPVIAVTALAMVGDRDKILAAGFDDYISKPIDPERFVRQVESVLPAASWAVHVPEPEQAESLVALREPASNAGIRLLVVDDTASNLAYLQSVLAASGYEVRTAESVAQACALASADPPDLVLSDLHMYPEAGTDLLARFQADPALAAVPVMILSSTSLHARSREDCVARGARRFLVLPIEPQLLLDEIAAVLEGRP